MPSASRLISLQSRYSGRHVLEVVGRHDQQVRLAQLVLRVARVEPDDGLERVVGRDVERQRLLHDQEQDALGARRRCQRARVLEERRGRQLRRQRGEVQRAGFGDGARGGDLG